MGEHPVVSSFQLLGSWLGVWVEPMQCRSDLDQDSVHVVDLGLSHHLVFGVFGVFAIQKLQCVEDRLETRSWRNARLHG